jgi:Ser/Thr protein kinase RdoA (MazF antagonist)
MHTFPVTTSTLSEKELGNFIIEKYNLTPDFECKLFRTGINHTYFLSNTTTKYAVRVYCYNWRTKTEIEEELKLLTLLKDNNLSVSSPVADTNGELIQEMNAPEGKRYAVLFTFAEGEKMRFMNNDTCFAIGELMAEIHNVTANKKIARMDYTAEVLVEQSYNHLTAFFTEDLKEMQWIKEVGKTITTNFEQFEAQENQTGIVHLDIWYDNLSVKNESEITIFDFDNCGNGLFILDVGYFCKQLFFIEANKDIYEQKVASFLKGYRNQRELSDKEMALIPDAGASIFIFYLGVQAQRFDWSNIFLSKNYLKMFVGRIQAWMDYYTTKNKQ